MLLLNQTSTVNVMERRLTASIKLVGLVPVTIQKKIHRLLKLVINAFSSYGNNVTLTWSMLHYSYIALDQR